MLWGGLKLVISNIDICLREMAFGRFYVTSDPSTQALDVDGTGNETGIIDLTNHSPFCPCLKRENDQRLIYAINTFQSGLEINRWLQAMYNTLICHFVIWKR